jgi:hypothetical protein
METDSHEYCRFCHPPKHLEQCWCQLTGESAVHNSGFCNVPYHEELREKYIAEQMAQTMPVIISGSSKENLSKPIGESSVLPETS